MTVSKRRFLMGVGQAGGVSAAFLAMQALGLAPASPARAAPIRADAGHGRGVKVVVLGAGIAGLVAAHELRPLGYDVTVLEARRRPGGRNHTVRGGDVVRLSDGSEQTCGWGAGQYQNFGPARLSSTHSTMLGYCRKLGVAVEAEVNQSRAARLQNDEALGGRPALMRQVANDTRGHVSELLMKCVNTGSLDAELSPRDKERTLDFLRTYGPLDAAKPYAGSDRAGYDPLPGAGDRAGVFAKPLDMHSLLEADFWRDLLFDEEFEMQATMLQPVGGMDRIPYAFARALGQTVLYGAAVTSVRNTGKGVSVAYLRDGAPATVEADFCICTLPLTTLRRVSNNFAPTYKRIIDECVYTSMYKIAWESRRFWEQDDGVYGGLSFCKPGPSPVWYPTANLLAERGVLVSGYEDEAGSPFASLTLPQKFERSRRSVERLHPGRGGELDKPIYYGWSKAPWSEGGWIRVYGRDAESERRPALRTDTSLQQAPGLAAAKTTSEEDAHTASNPEYEALLRPDGRILFAGDHASHLVGWQEGAALSALRAIDLINAQVGSAAA